jgi:AmmeMemoRadiSam system protein A
MLEPRERLRLLDLAHRSVASGVGRRQPEPSPRETWPPVLLEPRATFTTLTQAGELRGCCGTLEPVRPLAQDVWHNAWVSAFADPRFLPVSASELDALEIAISVLTPLEPIPAANEVELLCSLEPHVDGLVLSCGSQRATFLPSVWESLPDPREFLAHLKRKAGWKAGALPPGTNAYRYRTETFAATRDTNRLADSRTAM